MFSATKYITITLNNINYYVDTVLGYFEDFEKLLQKEIFIRLLEK